MSVMKVSNRNFCIPHPASHNRRPQLNTYIHTLRASLHARIHTTSPPMLCEQPPDLAPPHAHAPALRNVRRVALFAPLRLLRADARALAGRPDRVRVEVDLHERHHVLRLAQPEQLVQRVPDVACDVHREADVGRYYVL